LAYKQGAIHGQLNNDDLGDLSHQAYVSSLLGQI
jgi:hypothetical protein